MNPWDVSSVPSKSLWYRLFQGGKPVGFRKKIGDTDFFSPDGYAWSGEAIPFDKECVETGLKNRSDFRVFDGDWVLLPASFGEKKPMQIVIVHHEKWGTLCWLPEQNLLQPIPQKDARYPVVTEILGTLNDQPEWHNKIAAALAVYSPHQTAAWRDVFTLALALIAGAAISIFGQLTLSGTMGPILSCGGGFLGAALFFVLKRRHSPNWMTRSKLFSLATRTALLLAVIGTSTYGIAMQGGGEGFAEARQKPIAALAGIAIACAMLSFFATIVAGDIVAWIAKGYSGEAR